jgi:hypothetical protein
LSFGHSSPPLALIRNFVASLIIFFFRFRERHKGIA